jgi:hypothetical protein
VHRDVQQALAALDAATGGLSVGQVARPVPGRWSIAEILEHLALAFRYSEETADRIVASGEARARSPRPFEWFARTLVIDIGYFPRAKAPDGARPSGRVPPERAVETTRGALVAMDGALARAAARFGERTPLFNHPYFAGLNADQWRRFHWRHTVHHMRQVRERSRA